VLCGTSDPLALAAAFRDQLKLNEIYIADLNAIQGFSRMRHQSMIGDLCRIEGMRIILDAGISDVKKAQAWLDHGVHKVVIGSETLGALNDLQSISARIEPHRLVFSLDFKNGQILSRCHLLASMAPMEALHQLQRAGWQEVILLDLYRVGSREGVDTALVVEAHACLPDLHLLIGGGIAKPQELVELKSIGVAGILLATALHSGAINAQHIARFLIPDS
jgi:phosphoribosylformimino-5-aminoimidazole carboxamide ribotide isomerase